MDQSTIKRLSINIKEGTDKNVTTPIDIEKQETKGVDNFNSTPSDKNVTTPADINSLDNTINNNTININNNSESLLSEINRGSKKIKDILNFIENSPFDISLKESLKNWYDAVGKGRVSVKQLDDKVKNLNTITHGNVVKMCNIINEAYLNGWFGFFNDINNQQGWQGKSTHNQVSCKPKALPENYATKVAGMDLSSFPVEFY